MTAGDPSVEITATVTAGASCSVSATSTTLNVQLPAGCGLIRITAAPEMDDGAHTVRLTAALNGKTASAELVVTVQRKRKPEVTASNASGYLNQIVSLSITCNSDVDSLAVALVGPSTASYGGSPIVGDRVLIGATMCSAKYEMGNVVMWDGQVARGVILRAFSRQAGSVPDIDTVFVTRQVPVVEIIQVNGEICESKLSGIEVIGQSETFIAYNRKDHFGTMTLLHDPALGVKDPPGIIPTYYSPNRVVMGIAPGGSGGVRWSLEWVLTATNDPTRWEFDGRSNPVGRVKYNPDC